MFSTSGKYFPKAKQALENQEIIFQQTEPKLTTSTTEKSILIIRIYVVGTRKQKEEK